MCCFRVITIKQHFNGGSAVRAGGRPFILDHLEEEALRLTHLLVLDQALKDHVVREGVRKSAMESHLIEQANRVINSHIVAEQPNHGIVHDQIRH